MTAIGSPTTKLAQRANAIAKRAELTPEERAAASESIAYHALSLIATLDPGSVAGYVAIRDEADPAAILDDLRSSGVPIALPAAVGEDLVFRLWAPGESLVAGPFGLSEPDHYAELMVPDLVLLPVVAFDRAGYRLGYGRGYYDRGIAALHARGFRPTLVGIAFAVQEVASVFAEPHDVRLDYIVTEHGAFPAL